MPIDYNLIKRVVTSFNNLHFDKDTGTLFSIPAARIHELRGTQHLIEISPEDNIALITLAASISNESSAIDILLTNYLTTCENRRQGERTFKNLHEFIKFVMNNETNLSLLDEQVTMMIIYHS